VEGTAHCPEAFVATIQKLVVPAASGIKYFFIFMLFML
jgi:hypothetical protein